MGGDKNGRGNVMSQRQVVPYIWRQSQWRSRPSVSGVGEGGSFFSAVWFKNNGEGGGGTDPLLNQTFFENK